MKRASRWIVFLPVAFFALLPQPAKAEPQPGLNAVGYYIDDLPPTRSDDVYLSCGSEIENNINRNFNGEPFQDCGWDFFMVHYSGFINIPEHDTIKFMVAADDGGTVNIAGQEFGTWNLKGCSWSRQVTLDLEPGPNELDGWFFEWWGGTCYMLAWNIDNLGWEIVPEWAFTTTSTPPTTTTTTTVPSTTVPATDPPTTTTLQETSTTEEPTTTSSPSSSSTTTPSTQPTAPTTTLPPSPEEQPESPPTGTTTTTTSTTSTTVAPSTSTTETPTSTTSSVPPSSSTSVDTTPPATLATPVVVVQEPSTTTEPSTTVPEVSTTVLQPPPTTTPETPTTQTSKPPATTLAPATTMPPVASTAPLASVPLETVPTTPQNVLEAPIASPEQVAKAVDAILQTPPSPDQAAYLATNAQVLAVVSTAQAEEIFQALDVTELDDTQVAALIEAVQSAPTEVRAAFEKNVDIFKTGLDTYVPVGSNIPVGTRRTLVAIGAVLTMLPPPTRIRR